MTAKFHALLKLHEFIGKLVCEEMGHDWRDINTNTIIASDVKRCTRCNETRFNPSFSSSTNTSFTIDTTEGP